VLHTQKATEAPTQSARRETPSLHSSQLVSNLHGGLTSACHATPGLGVPTSALRLFELREVAPGAELSDSTQRVAVALPDCSALSHPELRSYQVLCSATGHLLIASYLLLPQACHWGQ
jgi:hypothetical protein